MTDVLVRFEPEGLTATVPQGATLHEAAAEAGVTIAAPCGGLGRCGSCAVAASGALAPPGPAESSILGTAALRGTRLACRARVQGPGEVRVTRAAPAGAARAELGGPPSRYDVEPRSAAELGLPAGARPLGAAVDIGTTTIAMRLHALDDGSVLGDAGSLNPQAAWGADVLTRVSRALAGDAPALRHAVTREIARLAGALRAGLSPAEGTLCEMLIVGNPTMTHLFLGLDAGPLASAPYAGALTDAVRLDSIAADMPELGPVGVMVGPAVSAFVGSDAVAAMLATGIADREDPTLLIDLGTNGEVVLSAAGRLLATSAAAGPAFEGTGSASGVRAQPGAIERVWLDGERLGMGTIGGLPALGICGSGLLDLIAVLIESGAVDREGRMRPVGVLAESVVESEEGTRFEVAPSVVLTQMDVRGVQLAKGAVATAIAVLLDEAGLEPDAIGEVIVAGGFGQHLRPASLVTLGLVPVTWAERVTFAGNAALAGASEMLLSRVARRDAARLARAVRTVPLAQRPDFQDRFLASLGFPASG